MLSIKEVSRAFGGVTALKRVSLDVNEGEIISVIGPNGAGKTTLLNIVTGVLRSSSGRVTFRNQDITRLAPHLICKAGIARTFQIPRPILDLCVLDNVSLGACFGKDRKLAKEATEKAVDLLEMVGLSHRSASLSSELNLVELRRMEIARALATNPTLLLLDEVVAGLNPSEATNMMNLIRRVRDEHVTIVLVEHLMRVVMGLSHRIVVLHHGEKIAEGSPQGIVRERNVIEAFLGEESSSPRL
jgi:branched-chain amino acid transport system ATP-binding protein